MNNIILSIYISTFNRSKIINLKVKRLLNIPSGEFEILVLDDASEDDSVESLNSIEDTRLTVIKNETRQGHLEDGVLQNWYNLLENCRGLFAFHLNDRDDIDSQGILRLISFLKRNQDCSGGLCNGSFFLRKIKPRIFNTPEESFVKIPYRGYHPTGIVFNMTLYKRIIDRKQIFTKKESYIHPHDIILGELCKYGKMFIFEKIWNMADSNSALQNKSYLYKKGTDKTSWFAPDERIKEFELFIKRLSILSFDKKYKISKSRKIAKDYLYFCTFNYAYYVSDLGQVQHYGIQQRVLKINELVIHMCHFVKESCNILEYYGFLECRLMYQIELMSYFWCIYFSKPLWNFYKRIFRR